MKLGDDVKYLAFKDYNGMKFPVASFATLLAARKWAKATIKHENAGNRLTIRVFKQMYFCRKPKCFGKPSKP